MSIFMVGLALLGASLAACLLVGLGSLWWECYEYELLPRWVLAILVLPGLSIALMIVGGLKIALLGVP